MQLRVLNQNLPKDTRVDFNIHKSRFEYIIELANDAVFVFPQQFSFVSVQLTALEGTANLSYTLDSLGSAKLTGGNTDALDYDNLNLVEWRHGQLNAGQTQIDFFENPLSACVIQTTGKAKLVVLIKDSLT